MQEYIALLDDIDDEGRYVFTIFDEDIEPLCRIHVSASLKYLNLEIGDEIRLSLPS